MSLHINETRRNAKNKNSLTCAETLHSESCRVPGEMSVFAIQYGCLDVSKMWLIETRDQVRVIVGQNGRTNECMNISCVALRNQASQVPRRVRTNTARLQRTI